jgi:ATP-dependent DNA helicase RecQ
LRGELDLIYVAPERLLTERFIGLLEQLIARRQVALFAIDEAHCVSQWGHDFRPEYIQLSQLHERFPDVPRMCPDGDRRPADAAGNHHPAWPRTSASVRRQLRPPQYPLHSSSSATTRASSCSLFSPVHHGAAGIVYCLSRRKVDETAAWLNTQGSRLCPITPD